MALALANDGQVERACALLEALRARHPRLRWPLATEAQCLLGAGRGEEAWRLTERAFAEEAPRGFDLHLVRYLAATVTGRDAVAAALRDDLLAVAPPGANPDCDATKLFLARGKAAEAQHCALRAAHFRPRDPLPRALLAAIALRVGDKEGARRLLAETLAEHPDSAALLNVERELRRIDGNRDGAAPRSGAPKE